MKVDTLYLTNFLETTSVSTSEYLKGRGLKKGDLILFIGVQGRGVYDAQRAIEIFTKEETAKVKHQLKPVVNNNYYGNAADHTLETVILEVL